MATEEVTELVDKHLRDYELVMIISPQLEDEGVDAEVESLQRSIDERGGVVIEVERWGKKKLAYPIDHFLEGSYVLARFKLKPESCKELERNWQVSEKIIRHLLIKLS